MTCFSLLLIAQDAVKEMTQRPDNSADLLFWACVGLAGVVGTLATFYVTQLKAWTDEREKIKLKYEQILKDQKVEGDQARTTDLAGWHREKEELLKAQAAERATWRDREAKLVAEKDEVYKEQTEMLREFLNNKEE